MQAIEFVSIVKDHTIPIPPSVDLASDVRVKVVVLFESTAPAVSVPAYPDADIGEFFGAFPDFPEREPQGEYERRAELD